MCSDDLLDQLILTGQRFVVCADLNCPGSVRGTLDSSFVDVLERHNMNQHVHSATQVKGNVLDIIATSHSDAGLVTHIGTSSTCFSDHHAVSCRLHSVTVGAVVDLLSVS